YKEPESHNLTIEGIERSGEPAQSSSKVDVANVEDKSIYFESSLNSWDESGKMTVRVPTGYYNIMGVIDDGSTQSMVGNPELYVQKDTTITLDSREANKININLEDKVERQSSRIEYAREYEKGLPYVHRWISKEIDFYAA